MKDSFGLPVDGYCMARQGRHRGRCVRPLVTPCLQMEDKEQRMQIISLLSPFYSVEDLCGTVQPTFQIHLRSSDKISQKNPNRQPLKCVSMVILNPLKLTTKMNYLY